MTEFAAQVETRLKRLPQKTAKPNLVARAATLRQSIAAKSAPATVEEQSRGLAEALLGSYPVPLAPRSAPDLARGRSEEHTSELQSLMRSSYAVFCLKKKR